MDTRLQERETPLARLLRLYIILERERYPMGLARMYVIT